MLVFMLKCPSIPGDATMQQTQSIEVQLNNLSRAVSQLIHEQREEPKEESLLSELEAVKEKCFR